MSLIPGEDSWVGVYRQKLHLESFDKTGNRLCEKQYWWVVDFMMILCFVLEEHADSSFHWKCTPEIYYIMVDLKKK